MFHVNDTVIYGMSGVCTVRDITTRVFGKEKQEYLVLSPVKEPSSVIYVPTANHTLLSKIRHVLSAEELVALIDSIAKEPCDNWIVDENARRGHFRDILQSGDRRRLIAMIKAIWQHGKEQRENGRKLHHSDEMMMKDAESLLYDEFSVVLNIPRDNVLPYIVSRVEKV